jgi:hypothetical protein
MPKSGAVSDYPPAPLITRSSVPTLEHGRRADITSNTYYDWVLDHVFLLVPAQDYVGQFLATFRDYPQRQKAASFNLDEVLAKLKEAK